MLEEVVVFEDFADEMDIIVINNGCAFYALSDLTAMVTCNN